MAKPRKTPRPLETFSWDKMQHHICYTVGYFKHLGMWLSLVTMCSNNFTLLKVSKLPTHNIGIIWTPVVVTTNCSPCLIDADLHPPFIGSGSIYQSNFTIRAIGNFNGNGCVCKMALLPGSHKHISFVICFCCWAIPFNTCTSAMDNFFPKVFVFTS